MRKRSTGDLVKVPVWVVHPDRRDAVRIRPGSGIVGNFDMSVGRVEVYYEGNLYGWTDMERYVQRCFHAWDRMITHYPTVARAWLQSADLIRVGDFDPLTKRVEVHPLDEKRLAEWLGMEQVPEQELVL